MPTPTTPPASAPMRPGRGIPAEIFRAYDIRGIAPDPLSAELVHAVGWCIACEARELGETRIVIGRDGRLTGPRLRDALAGGLLAGGVSVVDLGQVPTPILYFAAREIGSGVMITGSHNPPELHCEVDGRFPNHPPDTSVAESYADLSKAVVEERADVGLAFDGDGDRLGVVDGAGEIIWPDRFMMLYAEEILARRPGLRRRPARYPGRGARRSAGRMGADAGIEYLSEPDASSGGGLRGGARTDRGRGADAPRPPGPASGDTPLGVRRQDDDPRSVKIAPPEHRTEGSVPGGGPRTRSA